jgi:hypothetical protein
MTMSLRQKASAKQAASPITTKSEEEKATDPPKNF